MTMMTNQEPPPMKAIVRFSDGKKGQFMINGIEDIQSAYKTLIEESGARSGVILVPKVKHIEHEPEAV